MSLEAAPGGMQIAPAPWTLKGRSWTFFLSGISETASFPVGWSSEWQAEALVTGGEFIGGTGLVSLVSYSESPVGPYDELIYIPGKWRYADGSKGYRVTRIYVSSKESTWNGRKNWNIPKQLASFNFQGDPAARTWSLAVSHPSTPDTPFFRLKIKPITLLSRLCFPVSTNIVGDVFQMIQPPLLKGSVEEECETDKWLLMSPAEWGRGRLMRAEVALESPEGGEKRMGDGVGFPNVIPWSIGMMLEDLTIEFGVSKTKEF